MNVSPVIDQYVMDKTPTKMSGEEEGTTSSRDSLNNSKFSFYSEIT